MTDKEVSRRVVIAGLCGALALAFAPVDRFMAGLGSLLDRIFGHKEPAKRFTYDSVSITIDGQTFEWKDTDWYIDPRRKTALADDQNDGMTIETPLASWEELKKRVGGVIRGNVTVHTLS